MCVYTPTDRIQQLGCWHLIHWVVVSHVAGKLENRLALQSRDVGGLDSLLQHLVTTTGHAVVAFLSMGGRV